MAILITGSTGLLGQRLTKKFQEHFDLICPGRDELNLEDIDSIVPYFDKKKPGFIIHTAAYTDVDKAETERKKTFLINCRAARKIAEYCRKEKVGIIYISTDYVFSGEKISGYRESEKPRPINFYGKTKYLGERILGHYVPYVTIIRTGWLYGEGRPNFVTRLIEKGLKENEVKVVCDQIGSPTYVEDLSEAIFNVFTRGHYSKYHITNRGFCSRAELAEEIFRYINLPVKVHPVKMKDFPSPARRPRYSILQNIIYGGMFGPLPSWKDALHRFLNRLVGQPR